MERMNGIDTNESRQEESTCDEKVERGIFQVVEEKYEIIKILGEGAQGAVYLVKHKNTHTLAACKMFLADSQDGLREMEVLRQIRGQGIPYLLDCYEEAGQRAIIMERIEGKSLREVLQQKKIMTEAECIHIGEQLAGILMVLHEQHRGMVYCDLKPENIMLTTKDQVYLIDYASVLYLEEKGRPLQGTPAYQPASGIRQVTPYVDTYALGAILYEMATGSLLQEGALSGKACLEQFSPGLQVLMQKCVRLHPEMAYQNAREVYEDFKAVREEAAGGRVGGFRRTFLQPRRMSRGSSNSMGNHRKETLFMADTKRLFLHGWDCKAVLLGIVLAELVFAGARQVASVEARSMYAEAETETLVCQEVEREDDSVACATSDEGESALGAVRDTESEYCSVACASGEEGEGALGAVSGTEEEVIFVSSERTLQEIEETFINQVNITQDSETEQNTENTSTNTIDSNNSQVDITTTAPSEPQANVQANTQEKNTNISTDSYGRKVLTRP